MFKLSVPELNEAALFPTDIIPEARAAILGDVLVGRGIGRVDAYDLADGKKLWKGGQWNFNGAHDKYIFFSQQESDGKHTSINRIHFETGNREKLYEELLPPEMQRKGEP